MILLLSFIHASPIKLLKPESLTPSPDQKLQMELTELKRQNHKLDLLLKETKTSKKSRPKKQNVNPIIFPTIFESKDKIIVGSTLSGFLLNSIRSTNLESPIMVMVMEGRLKGAKLLCRGLTTHKRVQTVCDKVVLGGRVLKANIQLLNSDGTAGLKGEYSDKKEEMIEGVILDSTAQGVLSALSDRQRTPFGDTLGRSLKNQLIQGSISGLEASKEIALDNSRNLEPIVTIKAGSPVLLYFKETLNDI